MNNPKDFFVAESIAHARSLPLADAVVFLQGLLQSCSDADALAPIRNAYIAMSQSDKQLELIQTGQLKLKFNENGGAQ